MKKTKKQGFVVFVCALCFPGDFVYIWECLIVNVFLGMNELILNATRGAYAL